jgi:hypothetical protein
MSEMDQTRRFRDVRFGSKADKPSRAKINVCSLWSKSGQNRAQLVCPLSAKSRHHGAEGLLESVATSAIRSESWIATWS